MHECCHKCNAIASYLPFTQKFVPAQKYVFTLGNSYATNRPGNYERCLHRIWVNSQTLQLLLVWDYSRQALGDCLCNVFPVTLVSWLELTYPANQQNAAWVGAQGAQGGQGVQMDLETITFIDVI